MAKFNMKKLLNEQSKAEGAGNDTIAFKIELLDIKDIEPSKLNKYSVDDVAELKASIELVGLQQNLVVRKRDDAAKYELLSGERRYTALNQLVSEGKKEFVRVPCKVIKSVDDIQAELQLIFANSTSRRLSGYELTWQAARLKELLQKLRENGYEMTGKTRDIVAELLNVSTSQAQIVDSIDRKLIPQLKEEFRKKNINTTTAYELSRLDEENQRDALSNMHNGTELTPREVKQKHNNQRKNKAKKAASASARHLEPRLPEAAEKAIRSIESMLSDGTFAPQKPKEAEMFIKLLENHMQVIVREICKIGEVFGKTELCDSVIANIMETMSKHIKTER